VNGIWVRLLRSADAWNRISAGKGDAALLQLEHRQRRWGRETDHAHYHSQNLTVIIIN
jgi:hypothetical protein